MKALLKRCSFVFLLAFLTACGDSAQEETAVQAVESTQAAGAETDDSAAQGQDSSTVAEDETLSEAYSMLDKRTGDLDILIEKRTIRVLTVYSAGRYYLDGPAEKGLFYEMFKLFENGLNKTLKNGHVRVHVVFIPVARNQLIPALLAGQGDVISASLSITPERQKLVDFSIPVSKSVSEILVTGPSAPKLDSIDDLSGQTIHVRMTSSYRESLEKLNQRFADQGKTPLIIEPISELLEDDDLVEMVNAGLLPWAVVDSYKTQLWDGVFKDLVFRKDIVFRSGAKIAWAFRKDSPKLEAALNTFAKKNRQGTLIGNVLTNRYVRDFDWAANALGRDDYKRFKKLEAIFKTYGEQYGMEYLMVAAQGYQESRLDQSVRSGAGAVGVMQVLPTTAAGRSVSIKNIQEVDSNIHAGVKYMSFLRERYFSDLDNDRANQTFLALGAYNAGPSRMIKLRAKAEKLGYNPNVWFDNVEVVAAREVGAETVQYVANIYKYYLAYKLTAETELKRLKAREEAGIK
jgi:membrane-bound lytic murein transglycosylase MltF